MTDSQPAFITAEQVTDNLQIHLLACIFRSIDARWNTRDVCSSYWRFYVNSRGGASVAVADGVYPLSARRVHLVPAWVRFDCRNDRRIDHFYIHFDLIGLPGAVVREVFNRPFTLPKDSRAEQMAHRVMPQTRGGVGQNLATLCDAKAMIYTGLAELIQLLPERDRQRCERFMFSPNPLLPAIRFIEDHLGEVISNDALAELCSLSPDHFIRVFAQSVGQTPAQYVLERRVATAAQRLLFGAESIEQIAQGTGFANRFHFSRAFAKRIGVPPATYRKLSRV